jgi:hypothetical protein
MRPGHARSTAVIRGPLGVVGVLVLGALLAVSGAHPGPAVAVAIGTSTTVLDVSATALQTHHPFTLTATVTGSGLPDPAPDVTGTVTFRDELNGTGTDLPPVAIDGGQAVLEIASLAVGTHTFRATYGGDTSYGGSVSVDVAVVVAADTVEASGVGLSLSKFYPVVDHYKDTVAARGNRLEPISVAIAVKNSSGKTVRKASISLGTGAYSWSWNGKSTAGTLQPAGTYVVVQTLKDAYGSKVVKTSISLSRKKLYWRTHTATKTMSQRSWMAGDRSAAGWSFTVPSAVVYGSLTAKTYAKGNAAILVRNGGCGGSAWTASCYDVWKTFNSSSWAWRSVSTSGKTHVSSTHRVRVVVAALGSTYVQKVRIVLKWAVLR